jgi:tetratricopeptide (TPR) repeat protein
VSQAIEQEIRTLRAHFWSQRDPEGRAFAPLADAYRRKGDLSEATSLVEDGLARLPDFTPGHLIAARISRARGDLEEARSALDRVLELDGHNVLALLERAELARDTGDAEGAMSDLRQLLELEPGHMGARAALDRLEASEGPEVEPDSFESDVEVATEGPELAGLAGDDVAGDDDEFDVDDLGWESEDLELETTSLELDPTSLEPDPTSLESDPTSLESEEGELDLEPGPDVSDFASEPEAEAELSEPEDALGDPIEAFDFELEEADAELEVEAVAAEAETEGESDDRGLADDADDGMVTRTMGDILARQGLVGEALRVYEQLARRDPEDAEIQDRLTELRQRLAGEDQGPPDTADSAVPVEAASEELTAEVEPELQDVAPQWADEEDAEADDEVATPFAWSEDEPDEEEATAASQVADGRERSIADYFDDLLAWSPGAVPVEHLAPDAPADTAPPESLAALGTPGERPPIEEEPAGTGDRPSAGSEEDLDDFRDWLKSLET